MPYAGVGLDVTHRARIGQFLSCLLTTERTEDDALDDEAAGRPAVRAPSILT
jgi:hypothetical protein